MKTITLDETKKVQLPNKPAILQNFDALNIGESITIKNTNNPLILFYQLLNERGNTFSWQYLEKGPQTWRVKVTKLSPSKQSPTIGSLAVEDYRKAELFHRFGIDYCCHGEKTLAQAFKESGISPEIWNELYIEAMQYKEKEVYDFEAWDENFLINYIINTHHYFVRQNIELISRLAFKVAARHGHENPELKELSTRLDYFLVELAEHIQKEEQTLFPMIKKLALRRQNTGNKFVDQDQKHQALFDEIIEEHQSIGAELKYFKKITRNYKLPANACTSYTHLYAKLMEFENDLVQHIHLENNILLPKFLN